MNIKTQLNLLSSLNGTFTEARLKAMGFSVPAIRRATRIGIFNSWHGGSLISCRKRMEAVDAEPGEVVRRVQDGKIKKVQVVSRTGSKYTVVDPETKKVDEVDADKIGKEDEDQDV